MSPSPSLRAAARLLAALALAPLAGACKTDNPNACATGDQRPECTVDATPIDATEGCTANPEICTVDQTCFQNACVDCEAGDDHQSNQCTDPAAAVCDGTRACRACAADGECDSDFCDDGTCVATDNVIYVASGAVDNAMCSMAMKCGSPKHALTKVTAARKYIHIAPSGVPYRPSPDSALTINVDLVIHGVGAIFERSGSNQIVDVTGGNVKIVGVTVRGAAGGGNADGIKCANATLTLRSVTTTENADRGIEASNCNVTVSRAVIQGNIVGGVRIASGRFSIVNSFVFANGSAASAGGGMILDPDATPNALEFNTVVNNTGSSGAADAGGVLCLGTTAITARNNLIYSNTATNEAFGTSCTHSYSVIGPGNAPAGTMVRSMTPAEVALINASGTTVADFHITGSSMLRGAAEPGSAVGATSVDFDGQARPNPAGGAADIGADEVP